MKELRCRAIFQELGTIPQVRAQAGFKRPVQRRANLICAKRAQKEPEHM